MNKSTARGRRRGKPETRAEVLEVARRRFLADGYQAVTLRSVAAEAGVDVALISYFFGSKKGLFGAALALVANPPEVLLGALPGDLSGLPERVLRALLHTWDEPAVGGSLRVMMAGVVQDPDLARLVKEVLEGEMIDQIVARIGGGADARYRAGAFIVQLGGLILARYVLQLEPVASMSADELVRYLGPGLRAALAGPRPTPRPVRA